MCNIGLTLTGQTESSKEDGLQAMASPYALPPTTQQCLLCPLGTALFWNWGKGRGGWFEKAWYNEDLNLKRFKWTKVLPLQSGNNSHQGRLKGCSEQEL